MCFHRMKTVFGYSTYKLFHTDAKMLLHADLPKTWPGSGGVKHQVFLFTFTFCGESPLPEKKKFDFRMTLVFF